MVQSLESGLIVFHCAALLTPEVTRAEAAMAAVYMCVVSDMAAAARPRFYFAGSGSLMTVGALSVLREML